MTDRTTDEPRLTPPHTHPPPRQSKTVKRENRKGAVSRNTKSKYNNCDTGFQSRQITRTIDKKNETSAAARALMGGGGNFHFSDLKVKGDEEVKRMEKEKERINSSKGQMKTRIAEQIKALT